MGKNPKRKGGNFEAEIARHLSEWWEPGRSDIFWKTQNSGARATVRKIGGRDTAGQHGDICASDPIGAPLLKAFTFSVKRGYNQASVQDLLDIEPGAKRREWETWIHEIRYSAKCAESQYWAIITKRDRRKCLFVAPYKFFRRMGGEELATVYFGSLCLGVQTFSWFLSFEPSEICELVE